MVLAENHLGRMFLSDRYFTDLITAAVTSCFGVAGVAAAKKERLFHRLTGKTGQPVRVRKANGKLLIDLHIQVVYGVNIGETVKSIKEKIEWVVLEHTGIHTDRINVFVDRVKE